MRVRHSIITAIALAVVSSSGIACDGNDGAGGVRETDADDQRRTGSLALSDAEVVEAMKAPQAPGRIIYDPPTDLSLTNAMRTRPDLVRGDTTRRDTSSAVRRDSTAGDATADTSGGAARRRRP